MANKFNQDTKSGNVIILGLLNNVTSIESLITVYIIDNLDYSFKPADNIT
jgi:hypothetical protein